MQEQLGLKKLSESTNKTHFGFKEVQEHEKQSLVGNVFGSVASNYDLMNDAMSLGIHRAWKWLTIANSGVRRADVVLDIAAGSADLSLKLAEKVGAEGRIIVTDINAAMLEQGRQKMIDAGHVGNITYCLANAEKLPFPTNHFDCITIGFGLRNVTHKDVALAEMQRCVKPGGRVVILEFSRPTNELFRQLYDAYSFSVIPKLGELLSNDRESYQYLVESIREHPPQKELEEMMIRAKFDHVRYHNLSGGIVALHLGFKY